MGIPFRALADFTYDWESWLDETGRVRWVNPAITRLTGYTVDEALAMEDYPLPLVVPADRPVILAVLERARQGLSGNHVEFRVLQKDGTERWTAISWQPLRSESGKELGVRTSVRDIDQNKKLESALEAALRRAETANRAKVEFLANVSHELRTPLVSILGYAELLRAGSQDPKQKRFLATIASQGRQLERLVSDLLDFSTLGAGSLPLRPSTVRPEEVVRETVRALLPRAHDKGLDIDLHVEPTPPVSLDATRLTQVVSNLLDNAIKYTDAGRVSVQSRLDEVSSILEVVIEDTGPGFPEAIDPFEPFRQAGPAKGGVGLGLAIAKRLCHAMGGDLLHERGRLGGACLRATFHAPVVPADADTSATEDALAPTIALARTSPLDILVVDDVASAREFLADALRLLGYVPRTASSGQQALEAARERPPDVTFIDLQMPDRDGWSVARDLRRLLGPGHVLVGASASHLLADSPGLAAAGFDAFLPKPTPVAALEDLLRRISSGRRFAEPAATPSVLEAARMDELATLKTKDGVSLLVRAMERIDTELPELRARLARARAGEHDLRQVVHELAGLFALVGANEARANALRLEARLVERELPDAELEELLRGADDLARAVTDRLKAIESPQAG